MNVYNKLAKEILILRNMGITEPFDQHVYRLIRDNPELEMPELYELIDRNSFTKQQLVDSIFKLSRLDLLDKSCKKGYKLK